MATASCNQMINEEAAHHQLRDNDRVAEFLRIFPNSKAQLGHGKYSDIPDTAVFEGRLSNGAILMLSLPIELSDGGQSIVAVGEAEFEYTVRPVEDEKQVIDLKKVEFTLRDWHKFVAAKGDASALPSP